jgi:hypothetical protein
MAGSENQIPADENAGASPQGTSIVVVCTGPNLANGAMWPNVKTFVLVALEDVLHRVVVVGFEHTEDVGAIGFVGAFRLVLLSDCTFPERKARWFVAFSDFEGTFFHASLGFAGVETALRLSALIRGNIRAVGGTIMGVIFWRLIPRTVFWCTTGGIFRRIGRGILRLAFVLWLTVVLGFTAVPRLAGVLWFAGIAWLSAVLGMAAVFSRFAGLIWARLRRIVGVFRTHCTIGQDGILRSADSVRCV